MEPKSSRRVMGKKVATVVGVSLLVTLGTLAGVLALPGLMFTSDNPGRDIGCSEGAYDGSWSRVVHKNKTISTEPEDLDFDMRVRNPESMPLVPIQGHPIINQSLRDGENTVWLGLHGGSGGRIDDSYWFSLRNPFKHPILLRISLNESESSGLEWILDLTHHISIRGDGNKTRQIYQNGKQLHNDWCLLLKPNEKADVYVTIVLKADDKPYYVRLVFEETWRVWIPGKKE